MYSNFVLNIVFAIVYAMCVVVCGFVVYIHSFLIRVDTFRFIGSHSMYIFMCTCVFYVFICAYT